mgnify:CR=1 FL=1
MHLSVKRGGSRAVALALVFAFAATGAFALGNKEATPAKTPGAAAPGTQALPPGPAVVASTSWVGGIAEAAGANVTRILAPVELRHPPEYDFRVSDIQYAAGADMVVWAGYEKFMKKLFESVDVPEAKRLALYTDNTPPRLRQEVEKTAAALGTLDRFALWAPRLDELAARLQAGALRADAAGTRVAVHTHYRALAAWLGYTIVTEITMGEMTPSRLQEILALKPDLVIDNWHMPSGQSLDGLVPRYVQLINFPGNGGTATLLDVLSHNGKLLGLLE